MIALGFGAVALRLADLQLLRRSFLIAKAERQQLRAVPVLGRRGAILDRNGEVLAQSVDTESVFVSARMALKDDQAQLIRALSSELKVNPAEIRAKLRQKRSFYAKRGAKLEATARLKQMKFAALSYEPEARREYPLGGLAGHVIGFTSLDGLGLEGVERQYQSRLAGKPGKKEQVVDARGMALPSQASWLQRPTDGSDVQLTIDAHFQHIAERELEKAWRKHGAKAASMVVMDPVSGEILALANFPSYDPNRPGAYSSEARRNRAVTDAFEPGSTFKVVTAALALEEGLVDLDTPVDCKGGRAEYFGRVVRDHGDDHLGVVPFRQVMAQSSNVGTVEVALKLGPQKLHDGVRRFGFGALTGVDLPGETPGYFRRLPDWTKGSMAAIPFGQELSCNLLHIARVYAAVANGGRLVTPHVARQADLKSSGESILGGRVRDKLGRMLEEVVEDGTGSPTALPGFRVAGKTGTAQKYNTRIKAYTLHDNVSSFAGYVPAEDPQFLCVVALDEPRGLTLGGWVAGPVFRASMSAMLAARGMSPDEGLLARADKKPVTKSTRWTAGLKKGPSAAEVRSVKVPDLRGKTAAQARILLAKANLRAKLVGSGPRVKDQYPDDGEKVKEFTTVKLLLEAPKPKQVALK